MSSLASRPEVVAIKARLNRWIGSMDNYIGTITNTWSRTPMGFGFTCKTDAISIDLEKALLGSKHFGIDTKIGGSQHTGKSFREDNRPDSLHIVLSSRPDPKMQGATCSVHLDSVSVVLGIDPDTHILRYDTGKLLQHLTCDLGHNSWLIVPGTDGTNVGFRF